MGTSLTQVFISSSLQKKEQALNVVNHPTAMSTEPMLNPLYDSSQFEVVELKPFPLNDIPTQLDVSKYSDGTWADDER